MDNPASGKITVTRTANLLRDRARRYKVFVDGDLCGLIAIGQHFNFPVAAGSHDVQIRIDWCSSPTVRVEVPPSGVAALECGPGSPVPFYNITFGRKKYVSLRAR